MQLDLKARHQKRSADADLVAAAAPVRDVAGRVVAAVNVSAPRFRFDDRLEDAAVRVAAAADALSAAIGGPAGATRR